MMKLAGIPVSDLTELTEAQKNSDEFQSALSVFNNTKPQDASDIIIDSESAF